MNKNHIHVNIDTVEIVVSGRNVKLKNAKSVTLTDADGVVGFSYENRVPVKGKDGIHQLFFRTMRSGEFLHVSGSPFAHKYGQNTFTPSSVSDACRYMLETAVSAPDLLVKQDDFVFWKLANAKLKRIDLVINLRLDDEKQVHAVIDMVSRQQIARGKHITYHNGCVSMGPGGGVEWLIKMYAKGLQCRLDPRSKKTEHLWRLADDNANILRIEVQLRASELKRLGLECPEDWTEERAEEVVREFMRRLPIANVTCGALRVDELEKLPSALRSTYMLHVSGCDLGQALHPRTLQRHRKQLMIYGVDITAPHEEEDALDGAKMKSLICSSKVCSPPQWLKDVGLYPRQ